MLTLTGAACVAGLAGLELAARWVRVRRFGGRWWQSYRAPAPKALAFMGHPYALYVKRPGSGGLYPSNSRGYAGKRELGTRGPDTVRIYCVGGSTMEAHDPAQGPDSSWPAKLQDRLTERFPRAAIECINAAASGYTSVESLIEFMLRGVDLRPDILLVYHNVNDVWTCQMVDGFQSDYAHARCQKPWDAGWINGLPQAPWWMAYQMARQWLADRFGRANGLLFWIANPPWQAAGGATPQAVDAFRRNITHLVGAAGAWSCAPVLIKWECDWSAAYHPPFYRRRSAESGRVYRALLEANNAALKDVAAERGCRYLDVGPFEPRHFRDTMHFSAEGLDEIAERVARGIEPLVASVLEARVRGGVEVSS